MATEPKTQPTYQYEGMTKDDQCTPEWLLDVVRSTGEIVLDPCSNQWSSTGALVHLDGRDEAHDGLRPWMPHLREVKGQSSNPIIFLNPPYSTGKIGAWTDRFLYPEQGLESFTRYTLVPVSGSSRWFQKLLAGCDAVVLFNRRIQFRGTTGKGPAFSSALFSIFQKQDAWGFWRKRLQAQHAFRHAFAPFGSVLTLYK